MSFRVLSRQQLDDLMTMIGVQDVDSIEEVDVQIHDVEGPEEAKHLCLSIVRKPEHVVLSREHELALINMMRGESDA